MTAQLARAAPWAEPRRFGLFLLVGVLNTAFGYAVFAALVWSGMHYSLALLLATVVGIAFNFITTGRLVFGNRHTNVFWRFVAVYGLLYSVNLLALASLRAWGLGPLLGQALLMLPMAVAAFLLNRRYVFVA